MGENQGQRNTPILIQHPLFQLEQHFRVYTPTPPKPYAISMTEQQSKNGRQDEAIVYEIGIQGHLDAKWAAWFEDMQIECHDNGTTLLTGALTDQSALYGVLKRIRDLGMPLVSVNQIGSK